jgi:hypothetical protein
MKLKKKKKPRKMTMLSSQPNLTTKKIRNSTDLSLVLGVKEKIDKMEQSNRQSEELLLSKENSLNKTKKRMLKQRLSLNEKLVNEIQEKMSFMKKLT